MPSSDHSWQADEMSKANGVIGRFLDSCSTVVIRVGGSRWCVDPLCSKCMLVVFMYLGTYELAVLDFP